MKRRLKIILPIVILLIVVYLCLPHYARQALRYLYPDIYDLERFEHHTVHAPDSCQPWAHQRVKRQGNRPPAGPYASMDSHGMPLALDVLFTCLMTGGCQTRSIKNETEVKR